MAERPSIAPEDAVGFWIHRVYQASRNELYRVFREQAGEDVTPEQWAVLLRLWERDAVTQSELSDGTFRDRPTMSRILDVMERGGLVTREVDPADRRARRIHLTRKGKGLEKKLVPLAREVVGRMTKGIPAGELAAIRATLRTMFGNLTA